MSMTGRIFERDGQRIELTALGFGAAPLGNMHRAVSSSAAYAAIDAAWNAGLRYFDTAPLYGHGLSEQRLGRALRDRPRDSYVISTKVGRLLEPCPPGEQASGIYVDTPALRVRFDYSYDGILRSVEGSLERLGLSRLDILYVHDVDAMTHGSPEEALKRMDELIDGGGWKALSDLRRAGVVKAIGAGVNESRACQILLERADPDLFLLAGRYTLLDQSAAAALLPACLERGVGVVLGGPFNSGVLATGPVASAYYDYAPASPAILARVATLQAICADFGVSLADAALQFPLRHPAILSVIPGSQSAAEVARNVESFSRQIPEALWDALEQVNPDPVETVSSGRPLAGV